MRLGVDFGTTRIVVAAIDRGNYPVVAFETQEGTSCDWFPPLLAVRGEERLYGWRAWQQQAQSGWTVFRSLKRLLRHAGPATQVELDGHPVPITTLLAEMAQELARSLRQQSSLTLDAAEPLEVMLGIPANANSNQRFLTVEAFRAAGFSIVGLLNEPSAASIELGHQTRGTARGRNYVIVYDLGGGTFDASLVAITDDTHEVVASEGIGTLGGDDFDEVLAELALQAAGLTDEQRTRVTQAQHYRLLEECRTKKEAIHPNTRKIVLDMDAVQEGLGTVSVPIGRFYEQCQPLVAETMHAVNDLLAAHGMASSWQTLQAVYVTGGGSELPLVSRLVREEFGRKAKRSAYSRNATAIGLAIQADRQTGYVLRERFSRHFGIWREADEGREVVFDPLFTKGTLLPGPEEPPLTLERFYSPAHNVGYLRYVECSQQGENGMPLGDITVWDEVQFPFDPALQREQALLTVPVHRGLSVGQEQVQESYSCDASGTVTVTITNSSAGYSRAYRLGRWAQQPEIVVPQKVKAKKTRAAASARQANSGTGASS